MRAWQNERAALRWGGSLGVVLIAYALIFAAASLWRSSQPLPPQTEPADAVRMELAPLAVAPAAPHSEVLPGPPQQEQHKAQSKPKRSPTATAQSQTLSETADSARLQTAPKKQAKAEPLPALAQESSLATSDAQLTAPSQAAAPSRDNAASDVAQTSAPPSVQAPIANRYAAPQTLSGRASQAMVDWQAQVLGQLERFKRYPRAAQRRRYEGSAQIRYAVDRQGNVLSVRLARSSGHEPLDTEALAAVQRASPLPPPPVEIAGDPVEVITPVDFFLR